jgi:hypothetical protein
MTASSTVNRSAAASAQVHGELIDLLIESVVLPQDPVARAAVVCDLLGEMCAAVEWLHGPELTIDGAADGEVASLRQLLAAGRDHHQRMRTLGAVGARVGGRA